MRVGLLPLFLYIPNSKSYPLDSRQLGLLGGEQNQPSSSLLTTSAPSATETVTEILDPLTHKHATTATHRSHGPLLTTSPVAPSSASTSSTLVPALSLTAPPLTSTWPTPDDQAITRNSGSNSQDDNRQWKIIGISVLTVVVIALTILTILFFDKWSAGIEGFLCCGGFGRRRRPNNGEEILIPDSLEKREWESKLAHADAEFRYPTMAALSKIVKEQGKSTSKGQQAPLSPALVTTGSPSPRVPSIVQYLRHPETAHTHHIPPWHHGYQAV